MKKSKFIALAAFVSILLSTSIQSCYYDHEDYLYGTSTAACDTTNIKFSTTISSIITPQCATAGCHNASTASAGANLSSYASVKLYITNNKGIFLGSIKQTSGFSPMPKGANKLAACDITKIETWINAGMLNN